MHPQRIRPLVIALLRRDDHILVSEGYDPIKRETFYRPLGGMIEFGEHSADALRREIDEELGLAITNLRYLVTLENIFVYNGQPGHEIVLVYDAEFVDPTVYQRPWLDGHESDDAHGGDFKAYWRSPAFFAGPNAPPLYPAGLLLHLGLNSAS